MPTISNSNAEILQEYIPKLLTYIKKYARTDIGDEPRTVGYKQVNFYHPNYINDHQTILSIVLTLTENLSISNSGFSLLLGDLYVFLGHLWIRSCEIELEKCQKKSHSELKRYIAMSLLSVGSNFMRAKESYEEYIHEFAQITKGELLKYSSSMSIKSIFSYKENKVLLNELFVDGFDTTYYFDYGMEAENLPHMTSRVVVSTMVAIQYKELEQILDNDNIGERLVQFYYQNNFFQKKQFRNIVGWIIFIALIILVLNI